MRILFYMALFYVTRAISNAAIFTSAFALTMADKRAGKLEPTVLAKIEERYQTDSKDWN